MKTFISSLFAISILTTATLFTPEKSVGAILDGGIDPANLGKGDWIYYVSQATNKLGGNVTSVTNIPSFMAYEKNKGMNYIIVKSGTGSTNFNGGGTSPQFNSNLIAQAHAAGLKIFSYTRSYGDDVPGEIALATNDLAMGADGFVIDAETEWESGAQGTNGPSKALQYGQGIKAAFPTRFLAHAPFPYISLHSSLPYKEFGYYCDAVMPQDYWFSIGKTPAQMVADMSSEWRNWQNGLTGQWTNSIKPIVAIGQADTASIPGTEITDFVNALKNDLNPATSGGYQAVNWWRADLHTAAQWTTIGTANIGTPAGTVNDLIVDNISATVVGTWTTSTTALDKYASDYRSKGQGTGLAYLQFRPSFWTAGDYQVYELHSQGSNRTTNAPHVITYNGGSQTVFVNQQVNGGTWNLLGTFNFAAGVGGRVRIRDDFSDAGQTVIADAIKFVYVIPAPPAAPSGLSATAASSSAINLAWTDNSANETGFVISRSTVSGGPYTDIATVSANTTSFTDSGLGSSTTYFYVVGATNAGGASADSNQASATTQFAVADLIIDNPAATVVGTWSTGTASTDKYGADYRYKGQGTGSAYLQFAPNILTAGNYQVYEWHPIGSNRSLGTPHIIAYNGATATVLVNQQINGGQWNLLGTFNFGGGTSGDVKITDGFSDAAQLAMADAIKFVYAGGAVVPNAPSGLTATAVSSSQINLSWTDNSSDESNFIVARSTTSGGPYTDIATLAANTTSFNNTGLSANTAYFYVVRATNAAGSSANSAQATATTLPSIPAAPSGLTATAISSSQINLSWTDNSTDESNFIVARSTTSGGPYTDIATLAANTTSFNNTGLSANTAYFYVVRATNAAGSSANSAQASATTLPLVPAAPSGLSATTVSAGEIDLLWTDNSANESNFVVGRSTTSGGPYSDIATLGANTVGYNNTGLSANTAYYYVVRATNTGGSSANSAQATATTLPFPPSAPGGLSATAVSTSQINLAWTDNSPNETSFTVARSATTGGPYSNIATLAANTTSFSDTNLSAATTYFYVVRASNSGGSSPNSNEGSDTTFALVPNAPSNLIATPYNATQINLTWTDNSANELNFIVARSTTAGGPYTDVATLAANATSFSNNGLATNTTYYYVVRATNAGGSSVNSAESSATTPESDLLIDNKSATVVGAWSTGTTAADRYGSDYRFIGEGTGSSSLKFTPYIASTGSYDVFEWHAQGANRATNAPHVITFNGGSQTIPVNQETNGGKWNFLGTFSFAAGTAGNVKITDGFVDPAQVVMADAIKLVRAPAPSAPSALTATTVSSSQINLAWTDTSTNESNFVVARGTVSGGPYTDIATLAANATSYNNTGLTPNTAYYYVVRATNSSGASANAAQATATTYKAVHVSSITMSWVLATGSKYKSRAVVNVQDSTGANVNAATVTGNFTGSIINSGLSGATGTGGNATITSTGSISTGTVTFTITGITGTSMTYDSAANVVSSATHSR